MGGVRAGRGGALRSRAQGFPEDYVIDAGGLSLTAQVAMAGNSVCPPIAAALVAANVAREEVAVA